MPIKKQKRELLDDDERMVDLNIRENDEDVNVYAHYSASATNTDDVRGRGEEVFYTCRRI